jgi:hypothetical protein
MTMRHEDYREWSPGDQPEDMPEPETTAWYVYIQPDLRRHATAVGHFRTCRLPKCRRARQCMGRRPIEEIEPLHGSIFPPCVDCEAKRAPLVRNIDREREEIRATLLAHGIDPDAEDER